MVGQRVKGMKKLFLSGILTGDKLNIVNHQHIDFTKLLLKGHCVLKAQSADELIHEFFRR